MPRFARATRRPRPESTPTQHFTQPPPRFSEASLVKRLEELGIGRPSTYASTLQTLKDREYVRVEKNRFIPEESGRLVTAFLERFFERYVGYDFTAGLEEELDDVSGGRADWQKLLDDFWRDFKPKTDEVMDQKPSEVTAALDEFLEPYLFPPRADGTDPRLCPQCGNGRLSLRGGRFGAFVACSNYPECKYTRKFGQGGDAGAERRDRRSWAMEILLKRVASGLTSSGGKDKRASIPKDVPVERCDCEVAEHCCRCRARSARTPRRASRSRPRSAAMDLISRTTANMQSSARPPRCSRPA